MKHSICATKGRINIEPANGTVRVQITAPGIIFAPVFLTPEQAGLLSQAFDIAAMECGEGGIDAGAAGVAAIEAREGVRS